MINERLDISSKPIKEFLDSVDIVLNSNTFILKFDIRKDDLNESLSNFLKSESFTSQLAQMDIDRNWYNLTTLDNKSEKYTLRKGNLLKENIKLKINKPTFDKREYLIAMLTGDTSKGKFVSFYGDQLESDKAEMIIDNLVSYLSDYKDWELYIVQPDFLKSSVDVYSEEEDLSYFDGSYGNDTATIVKCNSQGFLILTNGTD